MTEPSEPTEPATAAEAGDPPVADPAGLTDTADAPMLAGDDVRPGPEFTDTPQAGGTEPSD